ncbi:hypothetical protein M8C21_000368, partial [Ambrosia artemisiifolia]
MTTRNFLDLQPRRPAIPLGQNSRRGQPAEIDDPSFLELTLGYTPPGRVNVQALNDDVIIIDSDSEMSADDEQGQLDTESQTSSSDSEDTSSTSTSVLSAVPVAPPSPPPPPPPPPPPATPLQPTFTCPICLGPIVDETSTRNKNYRSVHFEPGPKYSADRVKTHRMGTSLVHGLDQ